MPCGDKTGSPDAPRGRGKRHITDEATLVAAIALVLKEHRGDGLLSVTGEKQVEQTTQYGGRGRGSVHRETRVIQQTRSGVCVAAERKTGKLDCDVGRPDALETRIEVSWCPFLDIEGLCCCPSAGWWSAVMRGQRAFAAWRETMNSWQRRLLACIS